MTNWWRTERADAGGFRRLAARVRVPPVRTRCGRLPEGPDTRSCPRICWDASPISHSFDRYDVYQCLMDYWDEVMQDDVYLVVTGRMVGGGAAASAGWEAAGG